MNEQVTNTSVVKSIIYNLIDYKIRRNLLTLNLLLDSFFMKWIIDKVDTIYVNILKPCSDILCLYGMIYC